MAGYKRLLDTVDSHEIIRDISNNGPNKENVKRLLDNAKPIIEAISTTYPMPYREELQHEMRIALWTKCEKLAKSFDLKMGLLSSYIYHFLSVRARVMFLSKKRENDRNSGTNGDEDVGQIESPMGVELNMTVADNQEKIIDFKYVIEEWMASRFVDSKNKVKALRMFYATYHGCKMNNRNFPKLTELTETSKTVDSKLLYSIVVLRLREIMGIAPFSTLIRALNGVYSVPA
jgi:hypothetical protein